MFDLSACHWNEWTGRLGLNNWTEALIKISILFTSKIQHQLNACAKVHGYLSYLLWRIYLQPAKKTLKSHFIAYFVQLVSEYFPSSTYLQKFTPLNFLRFFFYFPFTVQYIFKVEHTSGSGGSKNSCPYFITNGKIVYKFR